MLRKELICIVSANAQICLNMEGIEMRENEKRLTLALDGETYKRLRQLGLNIGKTNQDMMEQAVKEYLARWDKA